MLKQQIGNDSIYPSFPGSKKPTVGNSVGLGRSGEKRFFDSQKIRMFNRGRITNSSETRHQSAGFIFSSIVFLHLVRWKEPAYYTARCSGYL